MKPMTSKQFPMLAAGWQPGVFFALLLFIMTWGCAVAPKTLSVTDLSRSFESGTIISAETGAPVSFETLLSDLTASRVIYVGEQHTNRSHHAIQLKIIQSVFEKNPDMAVGMEMFDRSYQSVLDQWSDGELDEKAFLRKTHWYANWRYDFSLYRDILEFVKEHGIRLVALNIPSHIPPKIREGGVENLRADEKKHLPQRIDTSNAAHREYLHKIFKPHQHLFKGSVEFEDYYMAQCVWEDTMAEAIAANLNADVMVVLAGNGHIQHKYGIPDRAFDRTKAEFRTIYLAGVGGEIELGIADFIWVTN
jgi:uncharacterized iron-regulated protein